MKMTLQLMLACLFALASAAADSPPAPIFQARMVLDVPSDQSEQLEMTQKMGDKVRTHRMPVDKKVLFDQTALESAKVITDERSHTPRIELTFTDAGRKRFAEVTREITGKRLAIVIDGRLYAAPRIATEIPGGKADISGSFSEEEAKTLVAKISESLPKR